MGKKSTTRYVNHCLNLNCDGGVVSFAELIIRQSK
jgi:hypothetical protein